MEIMTKTKSVMLVGDHRLFREALAWVINREPLMMVAAQTGSFPEGCEAILGDVDAAVVAVPDDGDPSVLERMRERAPHVPVLALAASSDPAHRWLALRTGAERTLSKASGCAEILRALEDLCQTTTRTA